MSADAIKNIGLTDKDFDMINEALENLPSKDAAGRLFTGLFKTMLIKDEEKLKEMQKKDSEEEAERKHELKLLKEDIRILQSKIIQLKRIFYNDRLDSEINDALNRK